MLRERHRIARERRFQEELTHRREAGNTAHRVGDYKAAVEHYTAGLKLDPSAVPLLLNRAATRLMLEEYNGALEDCKKALELQPESAKAYLRCSRTMMLLGDFHGAETLLLKGMEAVPASDRADMQVQLSGTRQVIRSLKCMEASLAPELNGTAVEARQVLRSAEEMEKMQQLSVAVTRPLRLRALLQLREPGRSSEAVRLSEELLQERQWQGKMTPEVWYWRALALLMAGDRKRAKAALREAKAAVVVEEDQVERAQEGKDPNAEQPTTPENAEKTRTVEAAEALLGNLEQADKLKDEGNRFFGSRRWEEAVECYENALRACTRDNDLSAVLHTNICASLRRVEQRTDEAYKHAMKAIEANPRYAKAFFRRGVLHYDGGRWEQSFEDFRRAAELEPHLQGLDAWLKRGRHAAREGKSRKNHYRELGLLCDCEQEEVKKKFRQMARECHPDKVRDAPSAERVAAEARFKAVNEAHEVLGTAATRKVYDFGKDGEYDHLRFAGFPQQRRAPPRGRYFPGAGPFGYSGFGGDADCSDDDIFFS